MSMATRPETQSPEPHAADSHDLIRVHGARENNLKDVSIEIPKRRLTVFTGVSGSGKSSLVFSTIAAESQRLINETYSAFVQGFMPTLSRPEVDVLDGLTELVGKSLVTQEEGPDQASRYRLLETMRAYARQQLAAGELGQLQRAHAGHYAAFAERAGPELLGPAQLVAWAVAGLLGALIALAFVQCAAICPQVGGSYAYAHEAFGPLAGFLTGWALYAGEFVALPVFPLAFTNYLQVLVPDLSYAAKIAVELLLIAVVTATNLSGVRTGGRTNDVLTIAKLRHAPPASVRGRKSSRTPCFGIFGSAAPTWSGS